jgi:hypothetical protein
MLISLIVVLLVIGVLLWAINELPGIDPTIKTYIRILVIVAVVLWIASWLLGYAPLVPPLRLR